LYDNAVENAPGLFTAVKEYSYFDSEGMPVAGRTGGIRRTIRC
jgi:hypothetical protein